MAKKDQFDEIVENLLASDTEGVEIVWVDDFPNRTKAFESILAKVRNRYPDTVKVKLRGESIFLVKKHLA